MRRPIIYLICFVIIATTIGLNGCAGSRRSALQSLIEKQWADYGANKKHWGGGVALYLLTPKGNYFVSTGMGDVNFNTHFRGASTTKTFTAAAIMLLQQAGILNIDDKITDPIPGTTETYLPKNANYAIPYKDQITIRQLLGHRAGVFDLTNSDVPLTVREQYAGENYLNFIRSEQGDDNHTFTFDEIVGIVAANDLSYSPPDTEFHYSNTGYSLLAKIIERVSSQRYDKFVQAMIVKPNDLNGTSFPYLGTDQTLPFAFVPGYTWIGGTIAETTKDNMSGNVAEGNVITTPRDLATWVKRWIRGEAGLQPKYVQMMMDVHKTDESHGYYGLGCNYTPGLGFGHNGAHMGYITMVRYDPKQDVTVLVFSNCLNASNPNEELPFMYNLGYAARELLGYPTSEATVIN
jgi:D-alanyl-D-alanine carboxypeptidase